jgi:O-antigen/teichoic acid export membrane protein
MSIRPERGFFAALRSLGGRFGWGVGDQALSSLTNFALGLVAARTLSSADFGAFAVVFAVYLLGLGAARAVSTEPMVIRFSAVSGDQWRLGAASATGTSLVFGLLAGIACITAGVLAGGPLGRGLVALGVTLPGLLLQDTWRFAFFAGRRGFSSFLNDLVWGLVLILSLAAVMLSSTGSVAWFVLAWGGAGAVAGLFGIVQASVFPRPQYSVAWARRHKDLIPRFLGEFSVTTVVAQVTVFGLGAIAGLAEVGVLRAGQILLGPLNVLFLGVSIVAVPEGVRALVESRDRLLQTSRRLSGFLGISALLLGTLLWSLPDGVGTAILRDNWAGAHSVVIPLALGMAAFGMVLGAGVGLRSLAAARLSLQARLLAAPLLLAGGLGGAAIAGARGAAWGLTAGLAAGAAIWWRYFLKGLREHERRRPAPGSAITDSVRDAETSEEVPYA